MRVIRHKGPTTEWKVSLPSELALEVDLTFYDSSNRKPKYGARSALVVALLAKWLVEEQKAKKAKLETQPLEEAPTTHE